MLYIVLLFSYHAFNLIISESMNKKNIINLKSLLQNGSMDWEILPEIIIHNYPIFDISELESISINIFLLLSCWKTVSIQNFVFLAYF